MLPNSPRHIVAVTGLVRDDAGLVLLVRSPRRGWELPGGQVEIGETVIAALHREIAEESGIEIEIHRLRAVYQNLQRSILIHAFVCRATGGILRPSPESVEVNWFSSEQAAHLIVHPAMRLRFDDLTETQFLCDDRRILAGAHVFFATKLLQERLQSTGELENIMAQVPKHHGAGFGPEVTDEEIENWKAKTKVAMNPGNWLLAHLCGSSPKSRKQDAGSPSVSVQVDAEQHIFDQGIDELNRILSLRHPTKKAGGFNPTGLEREPS